MGSEGGRDRTSFLTRVRGDRCLPGRVAINSGPVIGSIVGIQKYVYDIFGPAVNLASRMEHLSEPREITLCEDMYPLISEDFLFQERGDVQIKGVGKKHIYVLTGEGRSAVKPSTWERSVPVGD